MSKENDHSTREHIHTQKYNFRFQSETLSPIKPKDGGSGKPRFSIEDMIYISSVGWEIVDPTAGGNEYMKGVLQYIEQKELQGYEHTGVSAKEYQKQLEELWGMPRSEW